MNKKEKTKPIIGKVIANSNINTITVEVSTLKANPLYGKKYKVSKNFIVHSIKKLEIGKVVRIISTKPISKAKKYKVLED